MRYVMPGTWWPERLTISDDGGTPRFEVRNRPGFATMLSLFVAGGEQVATIRRRRGGRFQVIVRGKDAVLVRRRGDRYDIQSTLWSLAAAGNVANGQYSINRDGLALATVFRQSADDVRPMQAISVEVGDGDSVALLGTVLAVEAVRYEHAGTYFNPRALLELLGHLLNPLNWLGAIWDR
jgi:hypothetical protein